MKRTLERELKVPEVAEREANETSPAMTRSVWRSEAACSSGQPASRVVDQSERAAIGKVSLV